MPLHIESNTILAQAGPQLLQLNLTADCENESVHLIGQMLWNSNDTRQWWSYGAYTLHMHTLQMVEIHFRFFQKTSIIWKNVTL